MNVLLDRKDLIKLRLGLEIKDIRGGALAQALSLLLDKPDQQFELKPVESFNADGPDQ